MAGPDTPGAAALVPEAAARVAQINRLALPDRWLLRPAVMRRAYAAMSGLLGLPDPGNVTTRRLTVEGGAGPLPALLHRPVNGAKAGLIVHFHGGGFCIGSPATHRAAARAYAAAAQRPVLSVGYRLAPEHGFPAAHDDAWAALCWAARQSDLTGNGPLIVMGESAGGNLAVDGARRAAWAGGPALAAHVLLYPAVDAVTARDSYRRYAAGFVLTRAQYDWFMAQYLGAADRSDPRLSPALAPVPPALAPALIVPAQCDILYDEGVAYGETLAAAGAEVRVMVGEGLFHDAVQLGRGVPQAQALVRAIGRWLVERAG